LANVNYRRIISQVHPDRFERFAREQAVNTESLKQLHRAAEALARGALPNDLHLEFYAIGPGRDSSPVFKHISVRLRKSLLPLYQAFGVISDDEAVELRQQEESKGGSKDINFLDWLSSTIKVQCHQVSVVLPHPRSQTNMANPP
jgi:hypothetical protein